MKTKIQNLLKGTIVALMLMATAIVPTHAASKTINTDRGKMEASATGYYLSPTNEKCMEYASIMLSENTTRLYLKSTTVEYATGDSVKTVPRWGGAGRKEINDYFYLKNYASIKLRTYTTHEAIYTNAHTVQLSVLY